MIGYMQQFGHENIKKREGGHYTDVPAAKQVITPNATFSKLVRHNTPITFMSVANASCCSLLWSYFWHCIRAYHASVGHCELATEHIFLTVLYNRMFHNVYILISNFWWMYTYLVSLPVSQTIKGWMVGWLDKKTSGKDVEWSHYLISCIILTCDWKNCKTLWSGYSVSF